MLYASFRFFCQQLFSKFFSESVFSTRSSLPRGAFSEPPCLSASRVMPKTATLVKRFFRILLTFFKEKYQLRKFIYFLLLTFNS